MSDKEIALELSKLSNNICVAMLNSRGSFDKDEVFTIVKNYYNTFLKLTQENERKRLTEEITKLYISNSYEVADSPIVPHLMFKKVSSIVENILNPPTKND